MDGAHHGLHDRQWIGHVLQDESRVGEIVGRVLVRGSQDVALPQIEEVLLFFCACLTHRLGDLLGAALETHGAHARAARHRPGELRQPATEIDDALAASDTDLPQRGFVQEIFEGF